MAIELRETERWTILSLGGSLIVPDDIDTRLLAQFAMMLRKLIAQGFSFCIVTGGGATARRYQEAARAVNASDGSALSDDDADWLGIHGTRLNAHLLRTLLRDVAHPRIITDPEEDPLPQEASVIIGAGWKPGWSTDYDAAILARRLGARRLVNLSNVAYVHAQDPREHPDAQHWTRMSWAELRAIIGDSWSPGLHVPFDPVAAKLCEEAGIEVAILDASDWENVERALRGEEFRGTLVG